MTRNSSPLIQSERLTAVFGDPSFDTELQKLLDKYTVEEILEKFDINPLVALMILYDHGFTQLLDDEQE